jgi:selenocysteine lyase/cysteine desulfurase
MRRPIPWPGRTARPDEPDRRRRIEAAGQAIKAHEQALTDAMLHRIGNVPGLADLPGVTILGGIENAHSEGLVCFALDDVPAAGIVARLNANGTRTRIRKADHYSGNVLTPLGIEAAVRVSPVSLQQRGRGP